MASKTEAQEAKKKLLEQFPDLTLGLSKSGDDYTITARTSDGVKPSNAPTSVDGVTVTYEITGDVKALKTS